MTPCASAVGAALIHCLAAQPGCLPPGWVAAGQARPDPALMAVLVEVARKESGFFPYAIHDETTKKADERSHYPSTREEAAEKLAELRRKGRVVGVGLYQITHERNHRRFGLLDADGVPTHALDPCRSMRAGAAHLAEDHLAAALQRYNSGRLDGAPAYAQAVMARIRPAAAGDARPSAAAPVPAAHPFDLFERRHGAAKETRP